MSKRKIKLYIACSLDGYIARPDGSLDWLDNLPNPDKSDFGYFDFYASVDAVLIGRTTYEWVLGFDVEWPYSDAETYILTQKTEMATPTPRTQLLGNPLKEKIEELCSQEGKDIWLVGGGQVITAFLEEGLIDEMIITKIPIILGEGIPLFPGKPPETHFVLSDAIKYGDQVVNLHYKKV